MVLMHYGMSFHFPPTLQNLPCFWKSWLLQRILLNQVVILIIYKTDLISNTVLSMNGIEKLLLQLLYIVSNSEIMNALSEIDQQSATLSLLRLISYQLSHSCMSINNSFILATSKELIDAPSFVSKLYCYIEFDDRTVFFPVIIDCILSLIDMNGKE